MVARRVALPRVMQHTAESISKWSHENSRSWNSTKPGQELDIYADLIPDDEFEERREEIQSFKEAYEDLFK